MSDETRKPEDGPLDPDRTEKFGMWGRPIGSGLFGEELMAAVREEIERREALDETDGA